MAKKKITHKGKIHKSVNLNAAGIDISAAADHYVAVPEERTDNCVRCFGHFTDDLYRLADWLQECNIETVALESTGVYWIPIVQILESRGIQTCLVNSKHVRSVPGRKTDVMDCQWLQYLHSVGLLNSSFRPDEKICSIRSIRRHRESMVGSAGTCVLRMQKALDQMNLKLHYVISDITGQTGLKIINAILNGQHDPSELAKLKNNLIKASEEKIAKALTGDYRSEHLFALKQNLKSYLHYQEQIRECEDELKALLSGVSSLADPEKNPLPRECKRKKSPEPEFSLRKEMYRIMGVDLTGINGISILSVYTIFTEIGNDFSAFASEGNFISWLGLCPGNKQSGGHIISTKTRKVKNRVAIALRMAAMGVHHAKCAIGDYYRRMRAKLGAPKAITATAAKLARIIYQMMKTKTPFDETMFARNEELYQKRRLANLKNNAKSLGYKLIADEPLTEVVP